MFDGQIFVVLVLFSFCRVSESGGKGLVVASPAFMAVSMIVSNRLVVLVACLMILVISPSTVVFLALILLSSKLRDNDGASVATGCGSNSKDNKVELSYQCYHCHQRSSPCPPPDGTSAPLVVARCMATAVGGFSSVVLFVVALAGMRCYKWLCFEVPAVATAVSFAAVGLTVAGLSGLVAAAILPFGLCLVLFGGAMVVDVIFGSWLYVLCQICQIHCYVEE